MRCKLQKGNSQLIIGKKCIRKDAACLIKLGVSPSLAYPLLCYRAVISRLVWDGVMSGRPAQCVPGSRSDGRWARAELQPSAAGRPERRRGQVGTAPPTGLPSSRPGNSRALPATQGDRDRESVILLPDMGMTQSRIMSRLRI